MAFELKRLSPAGVPAALDKAERYRLLNEPHQAESICLDVLAVDPANHDALVTLILALADQFGEGLGARFDKARALVDKLPSAYDRAYYQGLVCERRGKAHHKAGGPLAGPAAFEWLERAMGFYDKALEVHPSGNDDAILRWNTCARMIMDHPDIVRREDERHDLPLE